MGRVRERLGVFLFADEIGPGGPDIGVAGTDRGFRANFDQEHGATLGNHARYREVGAHT